MTMDEMKELREAHNRIRYLEARLELVSEDGRPNPVTVSPAGTTQSSCKMTAFRD
jgi:hypothetical protein